jgi:ClpP class serine protease
LDKVPEAERTHNHEIESSRLSGKESQIIVEVDKAVMVLHDDGTAAAMAEAVQQIREDMQQVVPRLAQAKVGKVTQNLEGDIITALQEMIDTLKKAQKAQENKNKPRPQQAGAQQDPPLVDMLAELKMIRALQMRVNTRTATYAKMVEGEQAENAELVEALKRLAEREQRIQGITRDLQMGKNQ